MKFRDVTDIKIYEDKHPNQKRLSEREVTFKGRKYREYIYQEDKKRKFGWISKQFGKAAFFTLITFGLGLFNKRVRVLWKEGLGGKKIFIVKQSDLLKRPEKTEKEKIYLIRHVTYSHIVSTTSFSINQIKSLLEKSTNENLADFKATLADISKKLKEITVKLETRDSIENKDFQYLKTLDELKKAFDEFKDDINLVINKYNVCKIHLTKIQKKQFRSFLDVLSTKFKTALNESDFDATAKDLS